MDHIQVSDACMKAVDHPHMKEVIIEHLCSCVYEYSVFVLNGV